MKFFYLFCTVCMLMMFNGCVGDNYKNIQNDDKVLKGYKLSIEAPKGSTIKIMNILQKYSDKLRFNAGKYHVVVTKSGYKKHDSWVTLNSDKVYKVELKKISTSVKKSKKFKQVLQNDYLKYVSHIDWNSNNERFSLIYDNKNDLIWALQSAYVDSVKSKKSSKIIKDTFQKTRWYSHRDYRDYHHDVSNYACKIDTLIYTGNYRIGSSKSWRFDQNNDIYICYKTDDANSKIERYGEMSHLNINGMTNSWFFPTAKQATNSNPFKKYQKYFQVKTKGEKHNLPIIVVVKENFGYSGRQFFYLYNDRTKLYDAKSYYTSYYKYHAGGLFRTVENSVKLLTPVRKPNTPYDKIIFNTHYTPEQKLLLLTSKLTEEALQVSKKKIQKPKKLSHIKPKKLTKGEFEKSSDFIKREKEYKKEIAQKNKEIDRKNTQMMKEYSKALEAEDIHYNKIKKHNKDPKVITKVASAMAQKAMRMIFGDPKFSDISYNADKEFFSATLYSSSNNLKMKVDIPIAISKAKKFKTDLLDNKLVPVVSFSVKNDKLHFKELKIISNRAKIEKELSFAKELDTPNAYKDFIKEYPNYKEMPKVKKMLQISMEKTAYNKASSLHSLQAFIKQYPHSKYVKKAKKDIADIKAQQKREAEAYERKRSAYNAKKRVGDKVCKDGTTSFILSITMKAFVERVNGESMQLRISDTEGTSPYYNGVKLYKDTLIWDRYNSWYLCR
ncbi:MAG: hypothetical protein GXO30_03745 [Epsilonproteobacteria bacterium]|nr:hypothetical protein [Campylobacterota bacterium]